MILDRLENAKKYEALHPKFAKAFDYLRKFSTDIAPGRYELDGDKLYVNVMDIQNHGRETAKLEAHKKYIDIQYIFSGDEEMGWKDTALCGSVSTAYDDKADYALYTDSADSWFAVPAGAFTIFFPEDAHAPSIGSGTVRKAVVKVLVD